MDESEKVTRSVGELLLLDVFTRHGIAEDNRRTLSPEQKQHIRDLVQDIKQDTEKFLQSQASQKVASAPKRTEAIAATRGPEQLTPFTTEVAALRPKLMKKRLGRKR
jgi:hypothetical protein